MSEAIQTIIDEFKTLSPDISKAIVFKLDGETLAASKDTTPEQTQCLITYLNSIKHTECIGGLQGFTIQDVNSQLAVTAVGNVFLATISSRLGDQKSINSLTKIVAPTVIRLVQETTRAITEKPKPQPKAEGPKVETASPTIEEQTFEPTVKPQATPEPVLPKTPSTQFMVEKIGGFLVASDTIRIDTEAIDGWRTECDGKPFTNVVLETFEGKRITCKFKAQGAAKGVIGVPDKILQALGCGKGTLIMVKPLIE